MGTVLTSHTLWTFLRSRIKRNNPTVILILFVLFTNLAFTAIVLPINCVALFRPEFMQKYSHFCSIFALLYFWVYGAILCTQGAIAVNRWALVCSSTYKFTKKTSVLAGGASWLTSAFILLIPVFINGWKEFGYNESSGTCTALNYPDRTIMFSVTILVPLVIIIVCYARIIWSVRRSRQTMKKSQVWRKSLDLAVLETQQSMDWLYLQNIERQEAEDRREMRMSLLISAIFVSYSVCTFPAAVVVQLDPDITKYPQAHIPTYILNWLGGLLVPVLYGLTNKSKFSQ